MARSLPLVGASIQLSIQFPNVDTSERFLRMTGEVVRVELSLTCKSNWAFAAASSKTTLHGSRDCGEVRPSIQ